MLLRIIDRPAGDNGEDAIQIVLQHQQRTTDFVTESYDSPFSDNFRQKLAWYFNEYLQNETFDVDVVAKLIKHGQNIGDELLGEDHQLVKISEDIEQHGYHNLQVQLESQRIGFFDELWEATVLPDSKYMLSSVVKGFVRQFVQAKPLPELRFDLKVTPATQDSVSKLLQGEDAASEDQSKNALAKEVQPKDDKPLLVLTLVSRAFADVMPFASSNSINTSLQAISAGGTIDYEVYQSTDWPTLQARLSDQSRPVHIVQYDGAVIIDHNSDNSIDNSIASIALDDGTLVSVTDLCTAMVENKVAALSIDARVYLQAGQNISASTGLAIIAQTAHQQGLGNIIGLGQITNPWTAGQCFESVYSQIANGLSLSQAIVEARKAMQSNIETSLMTAKPVPFHPWSLLLHYSVQEVTFFDASHLPADPSSDLSSGPVMGCFPDKLFGFKTELLPPMLYQASDGQVLKVIDQMATAGRQTVSIIGGDGTGKSHLAHVVSLYLAQKQQIDYGFYFDFNSHQYTPNDMLEMIAPVLALDVNDKKQVEQKLATLHCCFVLDDVLPSLSKELSDELSEFVDKLIGHGHKVMILADVTSPLHDLATVKIKTVALSVVEQKILAAHSLRQLNLTPDIQAQLQPRDWQELLVSLKGHPWLTKKFMPLLVGNNAGNNAETAKAQAEQLKDVSVEAFYQSQWQTLSHTWQNLLLLCADVRGLLLEMLMIAFDQQPAFAPSKTLFTLLGDADAKFAQGLELWDRAGFVTRFPHGRMIDERCLNFLAAKRAQCFNGIDQQALSLPFSQLICHGVSLLSQHVLKQPNPNITNNLLINRRHWVKHFETLWFAKDYSGFIGVKGVFEQLLQQAKLTQESLDWSADLLQRTPPISNSDDVSMEAKVSWLMLASGVAAQAGMQNNDVLAQGAKVWQDWFNVLPESVEQSQLPLFQQVVTFLERFYQSQGKWHDAIIICQKALVIYSQFEAWQRVIQSLKSLAGYHVEIGQKDQALTFENKIINDIPYTDAPAGFKTQQMLDVLMVRLARGDTEQAQHLLEQIRQTDEAPKLADMLDEVQADLLRQGQSDSAPLLH
ncbi:MAG: hypothetical protein HRT35_22325 [Algicola sp.]|nr:hypothetical protein [Algicola sp.]